MTDCKSMGVGVGVGVGVGKGCKKKRKETKTSVNGLSNKVYGTHRHFSFLLESLLSLLFLLYFF